MTELNGVSKNIVAADAALAEHAVALQASRSKRLAGSLLIALSATCFGAMAIFTRFAYASGADLYGILLTRFFLAFIVLASIMRVRHASWPPRADLLRLSCMGIGYVAQAFCFFSAIAHAQASLVALLLYLYPSFVLLLAVVFLREQITNSKVLALLLCTVGAALTVGTGHGEMIGIVFAIAAAMIYAVYITAGSRVTSGIDPLAATAVICGSSTLMFALVAAVRYLAGFAPHFPQSSGAWAAVAAVAIISTVISVISFFAGLALLGPTQASMLSTLEPVVTVVLAALFLGETIGMAQIAGGVLILSAVILLTRGHTVATTAAQSVSGHI